MINAGKVRSLGRLLLKLETRSRSGSSRKLLILNISYLIPGIFLPWLLVKQNTDPTGFEYSFLTFLFFSLILSFTIITELDNLIISKAESDILSSMPVDDRLLVGAKMYMIWRYTVFLCIPLLAPGSFFYYKIMKSFPRAFLYFACGLMLSFFIVYALILLYSIALKIFKSKNLGTYTLIFQLIMILALIFGYQFISFGISGKTGANISSYVHALQNKGVINYFPQAWYAFLTTRNHYVLDVPLILKFFLPLFLCYMSYFSLRMYLTENYSCIRGKFQYSRIIEPGTFKEKDRFLIFRMVSDFIQHGYLRNNSERSSYGLIKTLFKADKTVRLAILPMIIIPIGLALFALVTNQLPAPFGKNYFDTNPVFHISILLCIIIVLNAAMLGIKVTNYPGVSWIYDSYPVESLKHFRSGFRKFFVVFLLAPVCIAVGIIFVFKIPLDQAIVHTLFIFASANLYNSIYNLLSKTLPFTKDNTMINSLQRMASILYPLLFGIIIIIIQFFVYRGMIITLAAILAIITITFWVNYFGFVRENKQINNF